jgi:hypothetical protein
MKSIKPGIDMTYEEYVARSAIMGRCYFPSLHLSLGSEWPHEAMHPDTLEMLEGSKLTEHMEYFKFVVWPVPTSKLELMSLNLWHTFNGWASPYNKNSPEYEPER